MGRSEKGILCEKQHLKSFHLFTRRTSGRDAPRTLDEAKQPGPVDNLILLPGDSHLSELSMALAPNRHFNRSTSSRAESHIATERVAVRRAGRDDDDGMRGPVSVRRRPWILQ